MYTYIYIRIYPSKYWHCKIIFDHFTKGICKGDKYQSKLFKKWKAMGGLKNEQLILFSKEKS